MGKLLLGLLLQKLRELGFSPNAMRLLYSYLTGRTQTISGKDGVLTSELDVTSAVPQGSRLGHILFLLYILALASYIIFSKRSIYADDTLIYYTFQH